MIKRLDSEYHQKKNENDPKNPMCYDLLGRNLDFLMEPASL